MYRRLESVPFSIVVIWLFAVLPVRLIGDDQASSSAHDHSTLSELADDELKSNEDEEYFELLKLFADTIDQVERELRRTDQQAGVDGGRNQRSVVEA